MNEAIHAHATNYRAHRRRDPRVVGGVRRPTRRLEETGGPPQQVRRLCAPGWSITSTLGAAKAPGYIAGINMNSNQTKERADATWALCRPRLDVVEDKGGRRIGLMKDSGKGVSYVVQAEGSGFVCNAFVEVDQEKNVAKYGPIVKQIAQSIQPQE
jgi:hypothetical protein